MVDTDNDGLEGLSLSNTALNELLSDDTRVTSELSILGWEELEGDVGELTVVGGTHWVGSDQVQGVGDHVITSLGWDGDSGVEWDDIGEVVRTHVDETSGVLIQQGGLDDWVSSILWVEVDVVGVWDW